MDHRQQTEDLIIKCVRYEALDANTLYDMLALRLAVFCVEQNCPYQDIDGKDKNAWHILAYLKGELVGTSRILMPNDVYDDACSIGRVASQIAQRGRSIGKKVVHAAVSECEKLFPNYPIRIGAQQYLVEFYRQFGFQESSESYLEDGIVHISMEKPALNVNKA